MAKDIAVEIEDLREFVGGADVSVHADARPGHSESAFPSANGTAMCYYIGPSPDAAADWIVIKGA